LYACIGVVVGVLNDITDIPWRMSVMSCTETVIQGRTAAVDVTAAGKVVFDTDACSCGVAIHGGSEDAAEDVAGDATVSSVIMCVCVSISMFPSFSMSMSVCCLFFHVSTPPIECLLNCDVIGNTTSAVCSAAFTVRSYVNDGGAS